MTTPQNNTLELPEGALDFAKEEYKAVRAEMLVRVQGMDTVLFRTIGFCALLYSISLVDVSQIQQTNSTFDGRFARYLVIVPPVVILVAWLDYRRRLDTLILCARYLARLEAAIYAPGSDHLLAINRVADDPPSAAGLSCSEREGLKSVLGYEVFYLSFDRFGRANLMRHAMWLTMLAGAAAMIWVQFGWLTLDPAASSQ